MSILFGIALDVTLKALIRDQAMLEVISSCFLSQNVMGLTFGANYLDLVFTENLNRIFHVKIGPPFSFSNKNRLHSTLSLDYILTDIEKNKFSNRKLL